MSLAIQTSAIVSAQIVQDECGPDEILEINLSSGQTLQVRENPRQWLAAIGEAMAKGEHDPDYPTVITATTFAAKKEAM